MIMSLIMVKKVLDCNIKIKDVDFYSRYSKLLAT